MLLPFSDAAKFLVQTIFDLYIFTVLLRIVFHWAKVDRNNPLLLMVARLTYAPLRPVYQWIPNIGGIDLAAVILLLFLSVIKISLLGWLLVGVFPNLTGLFIFAFSELLRQLVNLFFYTILALALMSWLNPMTLGSLVEILVKISEPLLRPVRRLLPEMSGIDFSPLIVMLSLKLVTIMVVAPLTQVGVKFMLYDVGVF